jgi:hypothetical protein
MSADGDREGSNTKNGATIVVPRKLKLRLDSIRDGRPRWVVIEHLLDEHERHSAPRTTTAEVCP